MVTVSQELIFDDILATVATKGLNIMGGLHEDGNTILLLGPGDNFWPLMRESSEMQDGQSDPFDRWSSRVVSQLAETLGAEPQFPFGGPPYKPFLSWAIATGRAWSSPVGMLVHDDAGLMVSFRGALKFTRQIVLPPRPEAAPCKTCDGQPCTTGCPVNALSAEHGYNVDACHAYLDTPEGKDCMSQGCIARRACPVSQSFGRDPEQSAIHMQNFHRS